MIFATAGHVDHGKTTIVTALTGTNTDRLPEEKTRGLTIDLGFAYTNLSRDVRVGFVDVPGHERFIKTMVAGIGGIDAVIFVVALDDGPKPQTYEHLKILELMGVGLGVVVFTKSDAVGAEHSLFAQKKTEQMLIGTFLEESPRCVVSKNDERTFVKLSEILLNLSRSKTKRETCGYSRMLIDRSFSVVGSGQVVTGSIISGEIKKGQSISHLPSGQVIKVRELRVHGLEATIGGKGERCAINLSGKELSGFVINRGDSLVSDFIAHSTSKFFAIVKVTDKGLKNRYAFHLHLGTSDLIGKIYFYNRVSEDMENNRYALIILNSECHVMKGDRFVIRDSAASTTLGGGIVIDPWPDRKLRGKNRYDWLLSVAEDSPKKVLKSLLSTHSSGLWLDNFRRLCNIRISEMPSIIPLKDITIVPSKNGQLIASSSSVEQLKVRVIEEVKNFHKENASASGMTLKKLTESIFNKPTKIDETFINELIEILVENGLIFKTGGLVALKGFKAAVSANFEKAWERILPFLKSENFKVPVIADLTIRLGMPDKQLKSILKEAVNLGRIVKISEKRYFLKGDVNRLRILCNELSLDMPNAQFTAANFRDKAKIGRNMAIEILEYFDSIRFTVRKGNVRTVLRRGLDK